MTEFTARAQAPETARQYQATEQADATPQTGAAPQPEFGPARPAILAQPAAADRSTRQRTAADLLGSVSAPVLAAIRALPLRVQQMLEELSPQAQKVLTQLPEQVQLGLLAMLGGSPTKGGDRALVPGRMRPPNPAELTAADFEAMLWKHPSLPAWLSMRVSPTAKDQSLVPYRASSDLAANKRRHEREAELAAIAERKLVSAPGPGQRSELTSNLSQRQQVDRMLGQQRRDRTQELGRVKDLKAATGAGAEARAETLTPKLSQRQRRGAGYDPVAAMKLRPEFEARVNRGRDKAFLDEARKHRRAEALDLDQAVDREDWAEALRLLDQIVALAVAAVQASTKRWDDKPKRMPEVRDYPPYHRPTGYSETHSAMIAAGKAGEWITVDRLMSDLFALAEQAIDFHDRLARIDAGIDGEQPPFNDTQRANLTKAVAAHRKLSWDQIVADEPRTEGTFAWFDTRVRDYRAAVSAQAAGPAVGEADRQTAQSIYQDMGNQYRSWKGQGALKHNRGAWWGSSGPGRKNGAKTIPPGALAALRALVVQNAQGNNPWRYQDSFSGGTSFHKREKAGGGIDFIYHSQTPV